MAVVSLGPLLKECWIKSALTHLRLWITVHHTLHTASLLFLTISSQSTLIHTHTHTPSHRPQWRQWDNWKKLQVRVQAEQDIRHAQRGLSPIRITYAGALLCCCGKRRAMQSGPSLMFALNRLYSDKFALLHPTPASAGATATNLPISQRARRRDRLNVISASKSMTST